ncbi:hypothetical protein PMAYCL1PPCAC_02137, partial [Pristionchus mayeri]
QFDDVHMIPYEMKDRNFRIIGVTDPVVISAILKEGYLRPSFDVVFKSLTRTMIDINQLIPYIQRRYGPIVRRVSLAKHGTIKVTFGRYQDAQRAIDESPHFKSLQVLAEEARPNTSFAPFANTDMQVLIHRSKETDRRV